MKTISKILFISIIFLTALEISGCFRMRGAKIRIGISFADTNRVEIKQIMKGFTLAPDSIRKDAEIIIVSADDDTSKQFNQIKDLIEERRIDILLLNCVNEFKAEEFLKIAENEDVPVISMLNIPYGKKVFGYLTPDYFMTAKNQSQYVIDATNGRGNVMVLAGNSFSDLNTTLTYRNIDYIRKFPNMNVVFQKFFNYPNEITTDVDSIIGLWNNNIHAIIANNDEIILKAVEVLKKRKLEKRVVTVGAGCTPDGVRAILNGDLSMSVDMGYENLGTKALTAAVDLMNLVALKDDGLKYKNDEKKVSWILSTVKSYDKRNINYIFDNDKKYDKKEFGLK